MALDAGALETITDRVLDALASGDGCSPTAVTFLLHRYAATSREDVGNAVGHALAVASADGNALPRADRSGWLIVFAEASSLSDDDRLRNAAAGLIASLRREWGAAAAADAVDVAERAWAVEACLLAADVVHREDHVRIRELVQAAIDELERLVSIAYRPGEGMTAGAIGVQMRSASALLTAYELTGRLPYSMLAEEIVQTMLRMRPSPVAFTPGCEAARVLARLAALHRTQGYGDAAVIASGSDYGRDAAQWLHCLELDGVAPLDAAAYGLALAEFLNLQ